MVHLTPSDHLAPVLDYERKAKSESAFTGTHTANKVRRNLTKWFGFITIEGGGGVPIGVRRQPGQGQNRKKAYAVNVRVSVG
jgi:hypothetical protein